MRSDGAFLGPFAAFLYTPKDVAIHFLKLFKIMGQIPGLPSSARETAILATGEHFGAAYEMYAHKQVAITSKALTGQQAEDIVSGKLPSDADEDITVAWEVARALSAQKGPLEDKLWSRAKSAFGVEGAAALIHYVGGYAYTSILLNGMDAPVPESR